ncbi:hypothetical protein VNO78_32982 [Psophocarpus tetragonolobus]|uniref:Uncharacterized protein n=1 Tax=Psophocarpus tetragonolobus TaxID=3891 RepID=A0AAN9NWG9_PSOTE
MKRKKLCQSQTLQRQALASSIGAMVPLLAAASFIRDYKVGLVVVGAAVSFALVVFGWLGIGTVLDKAPVFEQKSDSGQFLCKLSEEFITTTSEATKDVMFTNSSPRLNLLNDMQESLHAMKAVLVLKLVKV